MIRDHTSKIKGNRMIPQWVHKPKTPKIVIITAIGLHLVVYVYQVLPFLFCSDSDNCLFLNPDKPIVEILLFLVSFFVAPLVFVFGIILLIVQIIHRSRAQ